MAIKILVVHRNYRNKGGEDFFLENTLLPTLKGMSEFDVRLLRFEPIGYLEIFFMAIGLEFLRPSFFTFYRSLRKYNPDHIIFNNFIPTLSLRLPRLAKKRGIKTWAWIHNSRFFCANGLMFNGHEKCVKCFSEGSRWDFYQNCHKNIFQSLIYALAYRGRRVSRILLEGLDHLICVSEFSLNSLKPVIEKSQSEIKVHVLRTPPKNKKVEAGTEAVGRIRKLTISLQKPFFAFIGRLSFEKGADRIISLAMQKPQFGFLVCGEGPMRKELESGAPSNVVFAGFVNDEEKAWIFENAEALIIPSRVPETTSLVITESQPYSTPVIYPEGGGAEETVKVLGRQAQGLNSFTQTENFIFRQNHSSSSYSQSSFASELAQLLTKDHLAI